MKVSGYFELYMDCLKNERVLWLHSSVMAYLFSNSDLIVYFLPQSNCIFLLYNTWTTFPFPDVSPERTLVSSVGIYLYFSNTTDYPSQGMLKAVDFARSIGCDSFVAVGGGSVIDTTKVRLFLSFPEQGPVS